MSQGFSNFITTLVMHFPVKHESPAREAEWLKGMAITLRGYQPSTLARAAEWMIENRKDRRFPLPAECREACMKAFERERLETPMLLGKMDKLSDWHPSREKLAYELLAGPLGKRAATEGWILALFDFTRKNMRLPAEGFEVANCIASAKGFDRAFENCVRGDCGCPTGSR